MEVGAAAVGFCALVLNIIPLISTGGSTSIIESLNWMHVKSDAYISYVGISASGGGTSFKILWTDDLCPFVLTQDVCDGCKDSFATTIAFVAIAFAFNVIGLVFGALAFMNKANGLFKIGAAVSALLAMASGIICVIVYSTGCGADIDKQVSDTLSYGPSWILMLVVLLLKFVEIFIWIAVKTMGSKVAVGN